jgi:hypothetical protein
MHALMLASRQIESWNENIQCMARADGKLTKAWSAWELEEGKG